MSELPIELVPLTPEQRDIVDLTRTFAREEIRPRGRAVDEADVETPWDLWRAAAKVGITGFMLPEEYGGGGFTDVFTQVLVQEELCVGDLGIGNLLCSNGFFADPVMELGTEEQKRAWLTPLAGPDTPMTSLATTEPGSGSDAASIVTTATRTAGGYLLNGQKAWISNAGEAEQYVVFAKTDPSQRSRGVTAFLLRKGAEGLTFGEPMRKMGQRAIVCREVFFSDVFVPDADRLGDEGQGFATSCGRSTSRAPFWARRPRVWRGPRTSTPVTTRARACSSASRSSSTRPWRSASRTCGRGSSSPV